jgi:predicted  nucleic acid-binding Zn-ribbon protein
LIEKIAGRVTSRIEENMAQISSNITAELSQARDNMLALTSEIKTIRGEVRTIQGVLQNVGHQLETDFQQNMILRKKLDTARKRLQQAEERKNNDLQ